MVERDLAIEPAEASRVWHRAVAAERAATAAGTEADWLVVAELYGLAETQLPGDHRLAANRGNALWIADQPETALEAYRRAVQLAPADPVVYRGLGNVHTDRQAFEAADRAYERSRALKPEALTAWNHSQLLIGLERYAEGYALAEQRWELPAANPWRDRDGAWRGEPEGFSGPLLIWSEQGLGDSLQHLRWLGPLLQRRGPQAPPVLLEVEPCLVALLQQGLTHLQPQPVVRAKPSQGPEPWQGVHLPLLSLPLLLGGAPLPSGASWLQAPAWSAQKAASGRLRRVGLVWAAGRKLDQPVTAREYRRRSLDPPALGALITGLAERGLAVELLQFGIDRHQADPWLDRVAGVLPADADFAATAAVVAALDLVITVDTAMAHLVGAMGRPGWVLLPFSAAPRWLRQRHDTPWYPSLRLFRQPGVGDWPAVVQQVLQALDAVGCR